MKRFVTLALVMALTLAFAACTPESPPLDPSSDAPESTQDVSAPASTPDESSPDEPEAAAPFKTSRLMGTTCQSGSDLWLFYKEESTGYIYKMSFESAESIGDVVNSARLMAKIPLGRGDVRDAMMAKADNCDMIILEILLNNNSQVSFKTYLFDASADGEDMTVKTTEELGCFIDDLTVFRLGDGDLPLTDENGMYWFDRSKFEDLCNSEGIPVYPIVFPKYDKSAMLYSNLPLFTDFEGEEVELNINIKLIDAQTGKSELIAESNDKDGNHDFLYYYSLGDERYFLYKANREYRLYDVETGKSIRIMGETEYESMLLAENMERITAAKCGDYFYFIKRLFAPDYRSKKYTICAYSISADETRELIVLDGVSEWVPSIESIDGRVVFTFGHDRRVYVCSGFETPNEFKTAEKAIVVPGENRAFVYTQGGWNEEEIVNKALPLASVVNRDGAVTYDLLTDDRELTDAEKNGLVSFKVCCNDEYVYYYKCTNTDNEEVVKVEVCRYAFKTGKFYKYCTFTVRGPDGYRLYASDLYMFAAPGNYLSFGMDNDLGDLCGIDTVTQKLVGTEECNACGTHEGGRWVRRVNDVNARLTYVDGIFEIWSHTVVHPEYGKLVNQSLDSQTGTALMLFIKDETQSLCVYDYAKGELKFLFNPENCDVDYFAYLGNKYVVHVNRDCKANEFLVYDVSKKTTKSVFLKERSYASDMITSLNVGHAIFDEDIQTHATYFNEKLVYLSNRIPVCETSLSSGETKEIKACDTVYVTKDKLFLLSGTTLYSYDGKKTSHAADNVKLYNAFASNKYAAMLYYDSSAQSWKTAK